MRGVLCGSGSAGGLRAARRACLEADAGFLLRALPVREREGIRADLCAEAELLDLLDADADADAPEPEAEAARSELADGARDEDDEPKMDCLSTFERLATSADSELPATNEHEQEALF